MVTTGEFLHAVFGANRRNLLTVASVAFLLVVAHAIVPHVDPFRGTELVDTVQYGTYLVLFCIWMVWFVGTGVAVADEFEE